MIFSNQTLSISSLPLFILEELHRYVDFYIMAAEPRPLAADQVPTTVKMETTFVEDVSPDEEKGKGLQNQVMNTFNSYDLEHAAQIEKKLVKRIDKRIMPLVVLIYIFSYLDRNSVSLAKGPGD